MRDGRMMDDDGDAMRRKLDEKGCEEEQKREQRLKAKGRGENEKKGTRAMSTPLNPHVPCVLT
jgi:hypothetical protein